MKTIRLAATFACGMALIAISNASAEEHDWPQWMGPNRDGVYRESGVIDSIPDSGLKIKWKTEIAGGYAGPAVAGGKVFLFDYVTESGDSFNNPGRRAKLNGRERLTAYDEKTGEKIWLHEYECPYSISYPAGPRCTPTVVGDHVYTLGSEGDLLCLETDSGSVVWKKNFKTDFEAETPIWGHSAHPLVDGDTLYVMVGGKGQGIVALDRNSGEVQWKKLDAKVGYCPPTIIERGGKRQLIVYHPQAVVGLDPSDGKEYWSVPIEPLYEMSIARPMIEKDMLYASGIRNVAVMIKLDAEKPAASELWRGKPKQAVFSANATPIFEDGVLFGTDCNEGCLVAVDSADGSRLWKTFEPVSKTESRRINHGTAFVTQLGDSDNYLLFGENGDLMIAEMTREGFNSRGSFHVVEPSGEAFGRSVVWSHPAYANRTAYIRNDNELVAVDLADSSDAEK